MRIKDGYILKKLNMGYVVIPVGPASMEFNGVIRLNETGMFLWQSIQDGADSREKLLAAMLKRYAGLDENIACQDLDEFLDAAAFFLE